MTGLPCSKHLCSAHCIQILPTSSPPPTPNCVQTPGCGWEGGCLWSLAHPEQERQVDRGWGWGEVCEGWGALVSAPHTSSRGSSIPSRPGPMRGCGDSGVSPGLGVGLPPSRAEVSSLTQEEGVGLTGGPGMATFVFRLPQGRPGRRQRPLIFVKKAQLSRRARADLAPAPSSLRAAPRLAPRAGGKVSHTPLPVRPLLGRPLGRKRPLGITSLSDSCSPRNEMAWEETANNLAWAWFFLSVKSAPRSVTCMRSTPPHPKEGHRPRTMWGIPGQTEGQRR